MRKFMILIAVCALLAGCTPAATDPTTPPVITTEPAVETEAPTETTPAPLLSYQIFLPNENADGFNEETVATNQITADSVLSELQARNVLPDTVIINAFGSEGSQLNIDFNQAFADLVCSMGTSGEMMIVGSVVNTYLSAFQAQSVYFTVDGKILESGHVIYDFPIGYYPVEPIE